MSQSNTNDTNSALLRELTVPILMIAAIGLFLLDSMHLSSEALIFPGILIVVVVGSLIWALAGQFAGARAAVAPPDDGDDEAGPIFVLRPWLIALLPAVLTAAFDWLGALVALLALVIGGQAILGIKSWLRSILVAIAVVAPTYIVFKYVLYARFPGGIVGF